VTTTTQVQLAGKLADLGNSWLSTLGTWGDKGLQVGLTTIVVITVVRKVSLKAGIGALPLGYQSLQGACAARVAGAFPCGLGP
jgi:hypothetical protein